MPYTKENLSGLTLTELKNLYEKIIAHKSALPDEDISKGYAKKTLQDRREKLAKEANRMDLIFDKIKYSGKTKGDKKKHLIDLITTVQDSEFIGRHSDASKYTPFDYVRDVDEPKGEIDPITGHVKYPSLSEMNKIMVKKEEPETTAEASTGEISEQVEKPLEKPFPELPASDKEEKESKIVKNVMLRRKARFDEDVEHFKELNEYLSTIAAGASGPASAYAISEAADTQKEMLSAIIGMNHNVNRKDKNEVNQLRGMMEIFAQGLSNRMSNDQYTPEESSKMKKGLESLKRYEPKRGKSFIQPMIQRIVDMENYKPTPQIGTDYQGSKEMFEQGREKQKPLEPFGGLPSQNEIDAPFLSTKSDKEIGNVRSVGFIGGMDQLAKVEDVTMTPSERSKSLKRFTNFRWVQSVQNSDLGYASPFQRMDDIDDRRRYGKCFMHTSKMPKDPDTQDELDKAKGFNKYPLVPSFEMGSRMQPAGHLSFINSTSKFARKLTADEMEPINQGKRNVNNLKNKLEFTTLLYNEDPLMKIKDKYRKNIVC